MTIARIYDAAGMGFDMDASFSGGFLIDNGLPEPNFQVLYDTGSEIKVLITDPYPLTYIAFTYTYSDPYVTIGNIYGSNANNQTLLSLQSIDLTINVSDFGFSVAVLTGNDAIFGNRYSDSVYAGPGADYIDGAGGNDLLHGNDGDDVIKAGAGNDRLFGDAGKDTLIGSGGDDVLNGGADNDKLNGGGGKDQLLGASGVDVLRGGNGADTLTGGTGRDVFMYAKASEGNDNITDFKRGQGDRIKVVSKNFGGLAKGKLAAGNFVANATGVAKDANDFFVFNTTSHTLYYDADGNGGAAAVKIATFTNGINLKNTDIVVA